MNEPLISSHDVAIKYNKAHDKVTRSIRKILEASPSLKNHFFEHYYYDTYNRKQFCYLLDEEALNILEIKYSYSAMSPRFELRFYDLLKEMFPSELIIPQYRILNYKIDFFMPNVCIIIEYDEEYHKYRTNDDEIRISTIKKELNRMVAKGEPLYNGCSTEPSPWLENKDIFSVIRVEKGKEIDGLRRICIQITENTMCPCSDFMNIV